ncbi:glycosyltransferase [bacterium]|nr:glycosyltransferase [bacterium]
MIVKNEEKFLGRCLESVSGLVDEIIVVDTGSTDNTVHIADRLNAKIFYYHWCDDFSQARNFSLSKASGEWILFMDADEIISARDFSTIKSLINIRSDIAGYFFIQRNYTHDTRRQNFMPCDRSYPEEEAQAPGFVPVERIALFRNNGKIKFSGLVHETVSESIKETGAVVGKTSIAVHHYGHLDKNSRLKKTEYYLNLGLKQIQITPNNPKPYYDVGIIYLNEGDFIKAEKFFLKTIKLNDDYIDILYNTALLYFKWHKFEKSMEYLNRMDVKKRFREEAMLLRATVFDWMRNYDKALNVLDQCIEKFPMKKIFKEFSAQIYLKKNDFDMADNRYGELHRAEPENINYLLGLMQARFHKGDFKNAYDIFKWSEKRFPLSEQVYLWAMMICAKLNLTDDLKKHLILAKEKSFSSMDLNYFEGIVKEAQGNTKEALEHYKNALRTTGFFADEINRRLMNIISSKKNFPPAKQASKKQSTY